MQRHYKGEITIEFDYWGEDENDAIEKFFYELDGDDEINVVSTDLDCVEEDDTDDIDYALDCEYESFKERTNDSTD